MRNAVARVLLLGALCAPMAGCSAPVGTNEEVAVGTASVPLTATGASGALYRLTGATFTVAGPTMVMFSTNDLPDSQTIDLLLNEGGYQITLQPGWVLERTLMGVTEAVEAVLVSANPLGFAIADQVVTEVSFVFQVDGDVIPMGQGVLRLGIAVQETGGACTTDPECPAGQVCDVASGQCVVAPGTCNTDAECGAGAWCFTSMSFGNFCVATGMGGVDAPCNAGDVFSCDAHIACVDIGTGGTCRPFCTPAAPMCAPGETCAAFQTQEGDPSDVGVCIVL